MAEETIKETQEAEELQDQELEQDMEAAELDAEDYDEEPTPAYDLMPKQEIGPAPTSKQLWMVFGIIILLLIVVLIQHGI